MPFKYLACGARSRPHHRRSSPRRSSPGAEHTSAGVRGGQPATKTRHPPPSPLNLPPSSFHSLRALKVWRYNGGSGGTTYAQCIFRSRAISLPMHPHRALRSLRTYVESKRTFSKRVQGRHKPCSQRTFGFCLADARMGGVGTAALFSAPLLFLLLLLLSFAPIVPPLRFRFPRSELPLSSVGASPMLSSISCVREGRGARGVGR